MDAIEDSDLDGDVPAKEVKGRGRKEVVVLIEQENIRKKRAEKELPQINEGSGSDIGRFKELEAEMVAVSLFLRPTAVCLLNSGK